jgi:hypothetical protein
MPHEIPWQEGRIVHIGLLPRSDIQRTDCSSRSVHRMQRTGRCDSRANPGGSWPSGKPPSRAVSGRTGRAHPSTSLRGCPRGTGGAHPNHLFLSTHVGHVLAMSVEQLSSETTEVAAAEGPSEFKIWLHERGRPVCQAIFGGSVERAWTLALSWILPIWDV